MLRCPFAVWVVFSCSSAASICSIDFGYLIMCFEIWVDFSLLICKATHNVVSLSWIVQLLFNLVCLCDVHFYSCEMKNCDLWYNLYQVTGLRKKYYLFCLWVDTHLSTSFHKYDKFQYERSHTSFWNLCLTKRGIPTCLLSSCVWKRSFLNLCLHEERLPPLASIIQIFACGCVCAHITRKHDHEPWITLGPCEHS